MEAENTKLFVCSRNVNLPIFVVTDRFMATGLFLNSGKLSSQFIICSGDGALRWGRELYRHYEGVSKLLNRPLQARKNLKPLKGKMNFV